MNPLLTTVATEVAAEFGSRLSAILAPTRGRPEDARARAIAMFVYQVLAPGQLCFTDVGRVFGRDRTTVRHALKKVHAWRTTERGMVHRIREVEKRVRARQ